MRNTLVSSACLWTRCGLCQQKKHVLTRGTAGLSSFSLATGWETKEDSISTAMTDPYRASTVDGPSKTTPQEEDHYHFFEHTLDQVLEMKQLGSSETDSSDTSWQNVVRSVYKTDYQFDSHEESLCPFCGQTKFGVELCNPCSHKLKSS